MRFTIDGSVCEIYKGKNWDPHSVEFQSKLIERQYWGGQDFKQLFRNIESESFNQPSLNPENGWNSYSWIFKGQITGKTEKQKILVMVLKDINKMESLLGNGIRVNTIKGYRTDYLFAFRKLCRKGVCNCRYWTHQNKVGYEHYLRSEKANSDISAAKYYQAFKKIY